MWQESSEQPRPLRTGLTTGTCATACALAAATALLQQGGISAPADTEIRVTLPKGQVVTLSVSVVPHSAQVRASTIKDAGDDPDVTHGATVFVDVALIDSPGVRFLAGPGVGTVTLPGLALAVGEPAINPVPRQMIQDHLAALAREHGYPGGFQVQVGVENGEQLALKTMNPRLGIQGGLSILGTTGIVRPFSCSAWIASIHQGVDVARANGLPHIAACTGNSSEEQARARYDLNDMALIEMGDFAGAVLKHLRHHPVPRFTLCGGFGKITKLANGHMDLNSRASAIDFEHLVSIASGLGADAGLQEQIRAANTSIQVLGLCQAAGLPLADAVCEAALQVAKAKISVAMDVEVLAINRQGALVGYAGEHRPDDLPPPSPEQ